MTAQDAHGMPTLERVDEHTAFVIRDDLCTGCGMCILACSTIKFDVFSFDQSYSYIAISSRETAASFDVRFLDDCDGCSYCLSFCGFDAIEKPEGWKREPHLDEVRRRHKTRKQQRRAEQEAN